MMFLRCLTIRSVGAFALCAVCSAVNAEDWEPIVPEELSMTREPKAPTAPAIYLYRQVDRDDSVHEEIVYERIKILTEEGRKYADVEIPYDKSTEHVGGIQARTIRPNGSIVNFAGTVFEKPIVKGRGVKLLAKTFTLPDVQVGSIVEYRYRHVLQSGYVFDSRWILNEELFIKHAKYSLRASDYYMLRYSWPAGLPEGTKPPHDERGRVRLETHDVPAFASEDHMPPENELKSRVDFIYIDDSNREKEPVAFWKKFGKQRYKTVDDFVDKPRVMKQAVAEIVDAADSSEVKLRKLYARAQQIRNLSYERRKTEQEEKREAQKEATDVGDVWKRGYGYRFEVTWLFLALARAAGIEADPVLVPTRDTHFFNEHTMNPTQINSAIVIAKLGDKELFLDPGVPFTPFGMLPWHETAVRGLRLNKDGGVWIATPAPASSDSRIIRKAKLRLTSAGSLEGTVQITYTGLEALWRRFEERDDDEADRKQFLEEQVQGDIPSGIEVKLTNNPNWNSADDPLVAEYDLKVPGWASAAGQRALLTIGLFGRREKHTFEHAGRVHPLYFSILYKSEDDITIELPAGAQASSLPQLHNTNVKVFEYSAAIEDKNGSLHIKRDLTINTLLLERKFYSQVRDFFQTVRTDDEQQVVISRGKPPARR